MVETSQKIHDLTLLFLSQNLNASGLSAAELTKLYLETEKEISAVFKESKGPGVSFKP
ncbi:hypothetical protein [Desulfosporosinus youngiae]|uniref:Uncharacterized protein n=1 Tax=Desulfosporosinus youngiae DSM 17734 TaxID=768710 RepID=H5XZY8_9FIRM|nr:hypothetical protein [Desulfosporosinus youngiae]EHQ92184.1 hypothetical protein DesyoDRAFT_5255 [Desulfosporosinus youngiae DSM 17734]